MGILALKADERVGNVRFTKDSLVVDLMDGRSISVPLVWYPKLFHAKPKERSIWQICGGGYGIHWEKLDEDISTEGLLRGAPAAIAPIMKKKDPSSKSQYKLPRSSR